ncbi:MAG: tyrosine-type recombinase/integrase [Pseudodesulfovibrio sp.]|nr:tyrosine-type recombinase/integrase [Pseudodesulfovibrio sp.]
MLTARTVQSLISKGNPCQKSDRIGGKGDGSLYLVVSGRGRAEWYYQWFASGKRRVKLKSTKVKMLDLADARTECVRLAGMVHDGLDPKEELEREEREKKFANTKNSSLGTVRDLFEGRIRDMKRRGVKTWKEDQRSLLKGKFAAINYMDEKMLAKDVSSRLIADVIAITYNRGSISMAGHLRSHFNAAFKYGLKAENDYRIDSRGIVFDLEKNPVSNIPRDKEAFKAAIRVLTDEEIRAFWFMGLDNGVDEKVHSVIKMIMATGGARVKEVVFAEKGEIDMKNGLFCIPKEKTKNGYEHTIPLTSIALEVLSEAKRFQIDDSPYLFPCAIKARRHEQPIDLGSPSQAIGRVCVNLKIEHWTARDIRRSIRTRLRKKKVVGDYLDMFFNHGRGASVGRKHYEHDEFLEIKADVMEAWETCLAEILKGDGDERQVER